MGANALGWFTGALGIGTSAGAAAETAKEDRLKAEQMRTETESNYVSSQLRDLNSSREIQNQIIQGEDTVGSFTQQLASQRVEEAATGASLSSFDALNNKENFNFNMQVSAVNNNISYLAYVQSMERQFSAYQFKAGMSAASQMEDNAATDGIVSFFSNLANVGFAAASSGMFGRGAVDRSYERQNNNEE